MTANVGTGLKFHEAYPSGLLTYHNTILCKDAVGRGLYSNSHFLNNLFLPTDNSPTQPSKDKPWYIYTRRLMSYPDPIGDTTSDYNGYGIGIHFKTSQCDPFQPIVDKSRNPWWPLKMYPDLKTDKIYETLEEIRAATGLDQHSRMVDYDVFANLKPSKSPSINIDGPFDFALRPDGAAVDAGIPLANINDDFTGKAPDLGAYELGKPVPAYGTSVEKDAKWWWSKAGPKANDILPPVSEVQKHDWRVVVSRENSFDFVFLQGNDRVFATSLIGADPQWHRVKLHSNGESQRR